MMFWAVVIIIVSIVLALAFGDRGPGNGVG